MTTDANQFLSKFWTSSDWVNEGESFTLTADLTRGEYGTQFQVGQSVTAYIYGNHWDGSPRDFDGDAYSWTTTVDSDMKARWTISVKADELTEGPETIGFDFEDEGYWGQTKINIRDTSKTPSLESIVNNGVYVNGDNNGTINFSSFNGTDGNDFIQGDTLSDRSDRLVGGNGNDRLLGYNGSDYLQGDGGDDFLHGMHGKDQINGGEGNDTMRGGHGHDEIGGGSGGDWIWGGIGKNTISVGTNDNAKDDVYVPVDIFQNTNGNPFGANADILQELGTEDKIFMHGEGLNDGMLSYGQVNHDGKDGVGIFVNGSIEALVVGGLNVGQVDAMTTGGFFA